MYMNMTQSTTKPWTGPIAGLWIDQDRFVISPPEGFESLDWIESTTDPHVELRRGGVDYHHARSADGRCWRREVVNGSEPGFRQIRETPEMHSERTTQMTMPLLIERMEAGDAFEFLPIAEPDILAPNSPHPFHDNVELKGLWKAQTLRHFIGEKMAQAFNNKAAQEKIRAETDPLVVETIMQSLPASRMKEEKRPRRAFIRLLDRITPKRRKRSLKKNAVPKIDANMEIWIGRRYNALVRAAFWRAWHNRDVLDALLDTGEAVLVSADTDKALGAHATQLAQPSTWDGENLYGLALMESRKRLRYEIEKGNLKL
jgi:hypothetical protein